MNFIIARDSISEVLDSSRTDSHKKFVISQILWSVATYEDMDSANGLIHLFDLNYFANGSHTWFETETAPKTRPLIDTETLLAEVDVERVYAKKKISMKGVK